LIRSDCSDTTFPLTAPAQASTQALRRTDIRCRPSNFSDSLGFRCTRTPADYRSRGSSSRRSSFRASTRRPAPAPPVRELREISATMATRRSTPGFLTSGVETTDATSLAPASPSCARCSRLKSPHTFNENQPWLIRGYDHRMRVSARLLSGPRNDYHANFRFRGAGPFTRAAPPSVSMLCPPALT
jgi:hypothetical protein